MAAGTRLAAAAVAACLRLPKATHPVLPTPLWRNQLQTRDVSRRCLSSKSRDGKGERRRTAQESVVIQSPFQQKNDASDSRMPDETDVVIVGGGALGMSTACWLKVLSPDLKSVTVIERDFTYSRAATCLSVGSIRQQFSLPENILMSLSSVDYLRNVKMHLSVLGYDPPDIGFVSKGYMFLASDKGAAILEENHKTQRALGAKVEFLTGRKAKDSFSWLNTEGVAAATIGVDNEGWFDPWLLLSAYKMKATSLGVHLISGNVVGFEWAAAASGSNSIAISTLTADKQRRIRKLRFRRCVNCGGPWSRDVARLAGIGTGEGPLSVDLPVEPRKRYVYMFHCPSGPDVAMPLLIDTSGAYVRREGTGGHYICGASPPAGTPEPDVSSLDVDYEFFNDYIWPILAHRVPAFQSLKLKSAWAGYYDYNYFDQNLLIGAHPQLPNFYYATGCSGHGIQHSPAIGRAMAELIAYGKYSTIDLTRMSFDRVVNNTPLLEKNII